MQAFLNMLENVALFVALAIPGFLLVKFKVLNQTASKPLSAVLTYVALPFFIIKSTMEIPFSKDLTLLLVATLFLGILFYTLFFFLSYPVTKWEKDKKVQGMMRFSMIFANTGFLGVPLANAIFGSGSTVVAFVLVLNIVNNLMIYTLGAYLVTGDRKQMSIKKAVLTPVVFSFLLGIIFNLLSVNDYVPQIKNFCDITGSMVTPLAMTIVGIKLADVKFMELITNGRMYLVSAFKLILAPVIASLLVALICMAFNIESSMVMGFFIGFAMPTATFSTVFAEQYDGDGKGACMYTVGASILAVPVVSAIYAVLVAIL